MKRVLSLVAAATLVACGPNTRDKNPNNGTDPNNDNQTTNGATNGQTNGDPNGTTNGQTNGDPNGTTNGTPNGTTNGETNNASTNNQTTPNNTTNNSTNNTTNNSTTNPCTPNLNFSGQIGGDGPNDGGFVTNQNNIGDAGLSDVIAGTPPTPDDPATLGVDEGSAQLVPPVNVDGAIVTATGGPNANQRFWLEDGFETIQVYLPQDLPMTIRVGMEVSFEAVEVQNFEGHAQISALANFDVVSSDNGVPVREASNRALSEDDYGHIVRVGGTLVGPPVDCGGKDCWDLEYPGGTAVFRTASTVLENDNCLTFVGPLYAFPGFLQNDATPELQLDAFNFDWTFDIE